MSASSLFQRLKKIQKKFGFLAEAELKKLSEETNIPLHQIHGVASFYPHFKLQPAPSEEIFVCQDVTCHLRGGCNVLDRLNAELAAKPGSIKVTPVSCIGHCDHAPVIRVNDRLVPSVKASGKGNLLRKILTDPIGGRKPTTTLVARHIDPYPDGMSWYSVFQSLKTADRPQEIIRVLKESGLRGMGGAGFPTGVKWELVRNAPLQPGVVEDPEPGVNKYVFCNADESEPGTFKDRVILQKFSHLVIEGMMIAMSVIGANKGVIFIRHEYSPEKSIIERELKRIGSPIEVFESPGGYICGEETALIEAYENKRSEPRNKPPFPGIQGVYGKPTLMNNVETFAWIPAILKHGPDWFKNFGRNGAAGRKLFALNGDVQKPGVYEAPMGILMKDLIAEFGGGMRDGKSLKAFLPGGASSGFLPASMADIPLDFQPLAKAGSMLGSGAVVAIAGGNCILDLALNLTRFFRNESCGKCVPCRSGTHKLAEILFGFKQGKGSEQDFGLIEELADCMGQTSICGLGQIAAIPALSAIRHFREEVAAHVNRRICPEKQCFGGHGHE